VGHVGGQGRRINIAYVYFKCFWLYGGVLRNNFGIL